jgi:hypothetical protein
MPLLPSVPAGQYRISSTSYGFGYSQLCKVFLFVLVAATGIRLAVVRLTTRRSFASASTILAQEKEIKSYQARSEKDPRQYGTSQRKDQQQPTSKPIYPWLSPPQALPGPYDPRLYPLPTIRRHSYDPSVHVPEQLSTISYSRRVSTMDLPNQHSILHGSVITSTKGWRRNQWVVSGS